MKSSPSGQDAAQKCCQRLPQADFSHQGNRQDRRKQRAGGKREDVKHKLTSGLGFN